MRDLRLLVLWALLALSILSMSAAEAPEPQPWEFLSQTTIGAAAFRDAHPRWDGRGVVIAVLDTGVDPGLAGLQTTSDGRHKIVDLRDFSGQGDVGLETARRGGDEHGAGLYAGDGPWLRGFEALVPAARTGEILVGYLREDRLVNSDVSDLDGNGDSEGVFGAIVYESEGTRRVVVDTDGDGRLDDEEIRGDYLDDPNTFTLGAAGRRDGAPALSLALNLWPDAPRKLTFVFDDGAHGSHVAGIAAGHRIGGQEDQHGIAPGAQLLSLKLGDNTLSGGATTSGSMWRAWRYAARWAQEHQVPVVIQMSYGIGSEDEGASVMEAEADRLLGENDLLVACVSNGNSGPGLSTSGLPSCARRVIATGAALNTETAAHLYGVTLPAHQVFYFSSRGAEVAKPDVLAPGVAASTVPPWREGRDVMRGTSMASPQAAGAAALILSAAKAEGWPLVGAWVREAFRRSAEFLPHLTVVDQGPGMLDVAGALEVYRALAEREGPEPRTWMLETESPDAPGREGPSAHWRGIAPPRPPERQQVTVRPEFGPSVTAQQKQDFYRGFDLISTAKWVRPAQRAVYSRAGREMTFGLTYTPEALTEPGLYTARIQAFDKGLSRRDRAQLGPEWELPVSVAVPHAPAPGETLTLRSAQLAPAAIERFFVRVPVGASGLEIHARSLDESQSHRLFLHDPEGRGDRFGRVGRDHGREVHHHVDGAVLEPGVYELVVYADYENAARAAAEVTLRFDALALAEGELALTAEEGGHPEGRLKLRSRSAAPLRARLTAEIVGFRVASVERGTGTIRLPIAIGAQLAGLDLHVEIDAETFGRTTDIAVLVLDSDGEAVLSDGLGQRKLHTALDRPGDGTFEGTLEILPALADPDDKGPFAATIVRDYGYASPIPLEIDGSPEITLYPDREISLDVTASATPPALPVGARWLVRVRAQDARDGLQAAELLLEAHAD